MEGLQLVVGEGVDQLHDVRVLQLGEQPRLLQRRFVVVFRIRRQQFDRLQRPANPVQLLFYHWRAAPGSRVLPVV